MSAVYVFNSVIAALSGVTAVLLFFFEFRSDGKLGKLSRMQSVAVVVGLALVAVLTGFLARSEWVRNNPPPVPPGSQGDSGLTGPTGPTDATSAESATTVPSTTTTDSTTTISSTTTAESTATVPPPTPPKPRPSIRVINARGAIEAGLTGALLQAMPPSILKRSIVTGRLTHDCRADAVYPSVTACDEKLVIEIQDLASGGVAGGVTLTAAGASAEQVRERLLAAIHQHYSGKEAP